MKRHVGHVRPIFFFEFNGILVIQNRSRWTESSAIVNYFKHNKWAIIATRELFVLSKKKIVE